MSCLKRLSAIGFVLIVMCMMEPSVQATEDDLLWWVLMGEAVGESDEGLYAAACVLRNRNYDLRGFDAARRTDLEAFVLRHSLEQRLRARNALHLVQQAGPDITQGANLYHNLSMTPYWATHPDVTFIRQLGNHRFYREKK